MIVGSGSAGREEAQAFYDALLERMGEFGLKLAMEKTAIMRFNRADLKGSSRIAHRSLDGSKDTTAALVYLDEMGSFPAQILGGSWLKPQSPPKRNLGVSIWPINATPPKQR